MYSVEGNRVARSTGLDVLLQADFDLKINDFKYRVQVPEEGEYKCLEGISISELNAVYYNVN